MVDHSSQTKRTLYSYLSVLFIVILYLEKIERTVVRAQLSLKDYMRMQFHRSFSIILTFPVIFTVAKS